MAYALRLYRSSEKVDFVSHNSRTVIVLFQTIPRQLLDLPARLFVERFAEEHVVFSRFCLTTCTMHTKIKMRTESFNSQSTQTDVGWILTSGVVVKVENGTLAHDAHERVRVLDGTEEHFLAVKDAIGQRLAGDLSRCDVPRSVKVGHIPVKADPHEKLSFSHSTA